MKLKDLVKLKPIIEAIEQGKTIQYKGRHCHEITPWYGIDVNHEWSFDGTVPDEYRIKPEPREWYELEYSDGSSVSGERYITRRQAELRREYTICRERVKIIKVSEVIE